jgi:hypothetical protein
LGGLGGRARGLAFMSFPQAHRAQIHSIPLPHLPPVIVDSQKRRVLYSGKRDRERFQFRINSHGRRALLTFCEAIRRLLVVYARQIFDVVPWLLINNT